MGPSKRRFTMSFLDPLNERKIEDIKMLLRLDLLRYEEIKRNIKNKPSLCHTFKPFVIQFSRNLCDLDKFVLRIEEEIVNNEFKMKFEDIAKENGYRVEFVPNRAYDYLCYFTKENVGEDESLTAVPTDFSVESKT